MTQIDSHQLAAEIKRRGREAGFELVGIAPAEESKYRDYFRQWLETGQAGTMEYLAKRFAERTDPRSYVPGAQSVVCVAMNYHVPLEAPEAGEGRVARYALGADYHEVMKPRLYELADYIRAASPGAETRACVDTAPVMEKELAARAGIGWMGKNCCVIHPKMGSWLFLGEIVTTVRLPADEPAIDRCGTCRRCIDACPTGAITGPYQVDARRCISYLTIEHRDELPEELRGGTGEWLYGCDVCQDVCPWNRNPSVATAEALRPRFPGGTLEVAEVLRWGEEDYRKRLKGSAMKRVKLPVLQRNARAVQENAAGKRGRDAP